MKFKYFQLKNNGEVAKTATYGDDLREFSEHFHNNIESFLNLEKSIKKLYFGDLYIGNYKIEDEIILQVMNEVKEKYMESEIKNF
jgi:HEPN domain-containing protein